MKAQVSPPSTFTAARCASMSMPIAAPDTMPMPWAATPLTSALTGPRPIDEGWRVPTIATRPPGREPYPVAPTAPDTRVAGPRPLGGGWAPPTHPPPPRGRHFGAGAQEKKRGRGAPNPGEPLGVAPPPPPRQLHAALSRTTEQ